MKLYLSASTALALVTAATAARAQDTAPPLKAAPVADLIRTVDIPHQQFVLKNGLRVIVSTDRKAPVVAVSVWYDVGSKHEPAGKTGFAHLFEHLMFGGSENNPGTYLGGLKAIGATDYNGTTYFDRTNYFETVPTPALERALFMESDRMGHLLGAIGQDVLDLQRGVVQNEKRQGDNRPYGLVQYKLNAALLPPTNPYGHTVIGSMADLDAASLDDVKNWFRSHYGPNNAVLVLAGDIDVPTARRLVEKYFGDIPAGPKSVRPKVDLPALAAPKTEVMKDRVGAVLVLKTWLVPGLDRASELVPLQVGADVLGGLASSRLQTVLVKQEKLAVQVNAGIQELAQGGYFRVQMIVRPGVDPAVATKRLDELLAEFIKNGPGADEIGRAVTTTVSGRIAGLESVGGFGGKAVALAEGELYENDPDFYKKQLTLYAAQTPASVSAAVRKWLGRPVYTLSVVPGARDAYQEAKGPPAKAAAAPAAPIVKGTRAVPAIGDLTQLSFPKVERTRLANGIELVYAQRTAVPITRASIAFDAGIAADVADKLGTEYLTRTMLEQGTTSRDSVAIAKALEQLGGSIRSGSSLDRTTVTLETPSANLESSTTLFADVVRNPAFADAEVARVRNQQLAGIQQELSEANALANRVTPRLLYGTAPYGKAFGGGDARAVATLTRADLVAWQQAWLRPDKAKIFVVSDRPLADVKAAFDRHFGDWRAAGVAGAKPAALTGTPATPKLVLVDKPDSPQSVIVMALQTPLTGVQTDRLLLAQTANDALGGSFQSRINMDLRETKHWSYGVFGGFRVGRGAASYLISAPVQADQTGPSLAALRGDVSAFLGQSPMTKDEYDRAIDGTVRGLAGDYETSPSVLSAMQQNDLYGRPDNYVATLPARYRAMTLDQLNATIRGTLDPARASWVVVGDAKVVRPQLDSLGLPVEVVPAAALASPQR